MSHRAKMIGGTLDIQPSDSTWNGRHVYISGSEQAVKQIDKYGSESKRRHLRVRQESSSSTITRSFAKGLSLMMNREPDMMVCGEAEEATRALAGDCYRQTRLPHR